MSEQRPVRFLTRPGLAPLVAVSIAGFCGLAPASAATVIDLAASDTGFYSDYDKIPHDPDNYNYIAGYIDLKGPDPNDPNQEIEIDVVFRDFFVFDLPAAPPGERLVAATMTAKNWIVSPQPPEPPAPQLMSLHGVLGSIDDLVQGNSSIADLGQGPVYGQFQFTGSESPSSLSTYPINAAGLAQLQAALGNAYAFSGRNSREYGGGINGVYVYGGPFFNPGNSSVSLSLTFDRSSASVPGPLPLLGAGAAWRWSRRMRAQKRMRGSSRATSRSTATVTSTTSAATTTTIP